MSQQRASSGSSYRDARRARGRSGAGLSVALAMAAGLSHTDVAEACPQPKSPDSVKIWRGANVAEVEVASDGFLVLDTLSYDPKAALEATTVVVTDAEGEDVTGTLQVLEGARQYLTWQATAPLGAGAKLKAVVTGALVPGKSAVPDEVELVVAGEPSSPLPAALAFGSWLDFAHGVGNQVQCVQTTWEPCGSGISFLKEAEELLHAVELSWKAPAWPGYVLREVTVEQTAEQRGLRSLPMRTLIDAASAPADELGTFVFPKETVRYCATLAIRDLRTGKTEKFEKCAEPERGASTLRDSDLANCREPPTPALTEAWCGLHPESELEACTKLGDNPPVEDEGDEPSVDEQEKPNEDDVRSPPQPTSAADGVGNNSSQGCQMSPGSIGSSAGVALLLGAFALVRRRRSR